MRKKNTGEEESIYALRCKLHTAKRKTNKQDSRASIGDNRQVGN